MVIQSGAIVLNYPLMNDPRATHEIVTRLSEEIMNRMTRGGMRAPLGV